MIRIQFEIFFKIICFSDHTWQFILINLFLMVEMIKIYVFQYNCCNIVDANCLCLFIRKSVFKLYQERQTATIK